MLLINHTIKDFAEELGSSSPAPGGGSTAALNGALGASLLKMVALLTSGRAKYAEHQAFIDELLNKVEDIQSDFLSVIDEDTEAFNGVSAVFSMPKDTDDEKAARKNAMQNALKACTKTPYKMMELCEKTAVLLESAVDKTNTNTASDLGVAALNIRAAAQGAWLNVLINLDSIDDKDFAEKYRKGGELILKNIVPATDRIYENIASRY